ASEGFFGVQDSLSGNQNMLLMMDYGIFYEFIPMAEFGTENPKTLHIGEVEKDVNYALLITTNAGLWRYAIGDTIIFTDLSPYRFKITGRTKSYINAFGEELVIENAETALVGACLKTNAKIRDYTAGPIYMEHTKAGAHQWLIEFEKEPECLESFRNELDDLLKKANSDYEAKRTADMALGLPQVFVCKEGTFYNWLRYKGKLGGQHKVPRLNNDRAIIDSILNQPILG
ncbi:MAG: hypothetical protein ACI83I_002674, partial [Bacteroidia bacterium]